MAFLRVASTQEIGPLVRGKKIVLRLPQMSDYSDWYELRYKSQDHLRPWEPTWSNDELSRAAFRRRLRFYHKDYRDQTGYAFFIYDQNNAEFLGGITLSNIRRGVTQSGALGYWIGEPFKNQGFMTDAVRTLVTYAFDHLRLHRVEAACLTENQASISVLENCSFHYEGLARKYLKINGKWQDHLLYAFLEEDLQIRSI